MSRFDDEVRQDLPEIYADAGDPADYAGSTTASQILVILDRDFEVQDEDQVAMRVVTISVMVADVATSRQGDTIVLPGRTWTVQQILEDDGHTRRLWVS